MKRRRVPFPLAIFAALILGAAGCSTPDPTPLPWASPALATGPGGVARGEQAFFATDIALGARGYVETEHLVKGRARVYGIPHAPFGPSLLPSRLEAPVLASGIAYTTRVVVRRPVDPARFNGTVVVEWLNVTDGFDGEYVWVQAKELLMRAGYAYVGVSAQDYSVSVSPYSLKRFSPARYGQLDLTGGGRQSGDALSYDLYGQVGRMLRHGSALLPGMRVQQLIGAGMSQSGQRLATYANHLADRQRLYDAFLIQAANQTLRDDLGKPVIKVLSETEARTLDGDQPDTPLRRSWWVAGSNHGDATHRMGRTPVRARDLGAAHAGQDACLVDGQPIPTRSRVPFRHVVSAALHALKQQLDSGTPPAIGPRFQTVNENGRTVPARDRHGNALGGIRLPHVAVPTARANGMQCGNVGAWVPFEESKLRTLYGSHTAYVERVEAALRESVEAGFVLPDDAAETLAEAKASLHGRGLVCGPHCQASGHYTADHSSTGLLREHTQYYAVADGGRLLNAINEAHLAMARGDSEPEGSARRRAQHTLASQALMRYQSEVAAAERVGRLTSTAASALSEQASLVLRALANR